LRGGAGDNTVFDSFAKLAGESHTQHCETFQACDQRGNALQDHPQGAANQALLCAHVGYLHVLQGDQGASTQYTGGELSRMLLHFPTEEV